MLEDKVLSYSFAFQFQYSIDSQTFNKQNREDIENESDKKFIDFSSADVCFM